MELSWPKSLLGFLCKMLWENWDELFGQPNKMMKNMMMAIRLIISLPAGSKHTPPVGKAHCPPPTPGSSFHCLHFYIFSHKGKVKSFSVPTAIVVIPPLGHREAGTRMRQSGVVHNTENQYFLKLCALSALSASSQSQPYHTVSGYPSPASPRLGTIRFLKYP